MPSPARLVGVAWTLQARLEAWWCTKGADEVRASSDVGAAAAVASGAWFLVRHDFVVLAIAGPDVVASVVALAVLIGYWFGNGGLRRFFASAAQLAEGDLDDE